MVAVAKGTSDRPAGGERLRAVARHTVIRQQRWVQGREVQIAMIVVVVLVATVLVYSIGPESRGKTILEPAQPVPIGGDPGGTLPLPPALPPDNGMEPSTSAIPSPAQPPPARPSPPRPSPAQPSSTYWTELTVTATTVLDRGQSVHTNRTRLVMEYGGDLAIYDETNRLRWSSGTAGRGYRAVFQADGNLVVYDQNWTGLWTSDTAGRNGAVLVLETDGNVCVVFRGQVIWAANTAH
jgi:hypothetical protein